MCVCAHARVWSESLRLLYVPWIELLLNFLYLLCFLALCSARAYFEPPRPWDLLRGREDWTEAERKKQRQPQIGGVNHASGIGKKHLNPISVRNFLDERSHQMADVTFISSWRGTYSTECVWKYLLATSAGSDTLDQHWRWSPPLC